MYSWLLQQGRSNVSSEPNGFMLPRMENGILFEKYAWDIYEKLFNFCCLYFP